MELMSYKKYKNPELDIYYWELQQVMKLKKFNSVFVRFLEKQIKGFKSLRFY